MTTAYEVYLYWNKHPFLSWNCRETGELEEGTLQKAKDVLNLEIFWMVFGFRMIIDNVIILMKNDSDSTSSWAIIIIIAIVIIL